MDRPLRNSSGLYMAITGSILAATAKLIAMSAAQQGHWNRNIFACYKLEPVHPYPIKGGAASGRPALCMFSLLSLQQWAWGAIKAFRGLSGRGYILRDYYLRLSSRNIGMGIYLKNSSGRYWKRNDRLDVSPYPWKVKGKSKPTLGTRQQSVPMMPVFDKFEPFYLHAKSMRLLWFNSLS